MPDIGRSNRTRPHVIHRSSAKAAMGAARVNATLTPTFAATTAENLGTFVGTIPSWGVVAMVAAVGVVAVVGVVGLLPPLWLCHPQRRVHPRAIFYSTLVLAIICMAPGPILRTM